MQAFRCSAAAAAEHGSRYRRRVPRQRPELVRGLRRSEQEQSAWVLRVVGGQNPAPGAAIASNGSIEQNRHVCTLKVDESVFPYHGYNRDVRSLATPENLARFEDRDSNRRLGTAGRSRNLLPEVVGPREDCFNYELSYDNVVFGGVTNAKINLLRDYEDYAPANNVFVVRPPSTGGQPMMLRDIVQRIRGNTSEPVPVHWSACRAVDRG